MVHPTIELPGKQIEGFRRRWHNPSLALFGSALREGSFSEGNLGILVTFDAETDWSLLDHVQMEQELAGLLGRTIDLLTKRSVERSQNRLRRQEILDTAEVIYGAQ